MPPSLLRLFLGCCLMVLTFAARAQDLIIDLQGNEIEAQIVEITPSQVLYRAPDADPALPPTIVDKRTLFMVRFASGAKEVFHASIPSPPPAGPGPTVVSPGAAPAAGSFTPSAVLAEKAQLTMQGRQDAERFYRTSRPFWGTVAATTIGFGSPLPAVIIGAIKPKAYRNKELDAKLLQYPDYVDGYERRAHQRKAWPVIGGYLVGLVGSVLFYSAIIR